MIGCVGSSMRKRKPMSSKREASVILLRPRWTRGITLGRFTTVRRAEKLIEELEASDPKGVERGHYTIDATPRAEAEYQRLRGQR